MSFTLKKYYQHWKAEMTECFNLKFGRTQDNRHATPQEPEPPRPNPKLPPIVLTRHFPPAKLYRGYLREYLAKLPRRNDEAIKARMEREKADKQKTVP